MVNKLFSGFIRYRPIFDPKQRELNELILTEILSLSGKLQFPFSEYGIVNPIFNITSYPYNDTCLHNIIESNSLIDRFDYKKNKPDFLHIQIYVDIPTEVPQKIERILKDTFGLDDIYGSIPPIDVNTYLTQDFFRKFIYDFVLALNLASPGSLSIKYGLICIDGVKVEDLNLMPNDIMFKARKLSTEISWPPIYTINIKDTWDWLLRQKDFVNGFSKTPTGRGINAFGNLFNNEYPISLFWAIAGIEAFYTKGHGDLQTQVREKSQLLLGTQEAFKKRFNSMYDFRSRFVHGDLDFPGNVTTVETEEEERYYKELFNSTHFAVAILISTIQHLITNNWSRIDFEYKMNTY